MALAAGLITEFCASVIGDVFDVEEKRVVQAARTGVLHGNVAVDAVPGAADELEGDVFGDVDGAVGEDGVASASKIRKTAVSRGSRQVNGGRAVMGCAE